MDVVVGGVRGVTFFRGMFPSWIPAFRGNDECRGSLAFKHTRKPFKGIFVPIAHAGCCRHTKV